MQTNYLANSISDLDDIAKQIIDTFKGNRVFILKGNMGAGKTTFVKSVCDYLEVQDNVCSPTFAIVNQYYSEKAGDIYHFDFYRINKEEEAFDIGFEEYLYSGNYCFIEWAEKIPNLLPSNYIIITIKEIQENKREITAEKI